MRKAWFGLICFFSALLLFLCLVWFFRARLPAPPPAYTLRDENGRVAVYEAGAQQPLQVYDIYTHLLPPEDVLRLQQGIPAEDEASLRALLEDLGL